jgi:hypothetical protein
MTLGLMVLRLNMDNWKRLTLMALRGKIAGARLWSDCRCFRYLAQAGMFTTELRIGRLPKIRPIPD